MELTLFSPLTTILFSSMIGLIFGALLQKGGVGKFDVIVGQLLLRDFTVMKIIMTAILIGSTGIYLFNYFDLVPMFHLSTTPIFFSIIGGLIFGTGMSLAGYCPGTAVVALASGAKDALFVFFGLLFGAWVYNLVYDSIRPQVCVQDSLYLQTLGTYFNLPIVFFIGFVFVALFGIRYLEKALKI